MSRPKSIGVERYPECMSNSRIQPTSNRRRLLAALFVLSMIFMAGTPARSEIRITHGPILGRLAGCSTISCKVAKGRGNRELDGFQLAHSDENE